MGRGKIKNHSRDGLFDWTGPAGEITPNEITDNPQARPCPTCEAPIGQRCRTRSSRRVAMRAYHPSRLSTEDRC